MDFAYRGKHVHFVGIGGVSMSGLAQMSARYGAKVTGSDKNEEALKPLRQMGMEVYGGENAAMANRADLVVYTSAVREDHPERLAAKQAMERSAYLGYIASLFDRVVAVAGTHGKTTVCGFLSSILLSAKAAFSAHIGGYVPALSGSIYCGGNELLVTEACEYQRHFLTLRPTIGLITNVEYDHPDSYPDLQALQEAFGQFGERCRILVCQDGAVCSRVHTDTRIYAHPYIRPTSMQDDALELMFGDTYVCAKLGVWGDFNRQNAALAAAAALLLGVDPAHIATGLANYRGAKRRQQEVGVWRGIPVISDYAHHPTEIARLTQAAKDRYGKIAVVFQAHTYSRTMALLDRFATCFVCDTLFLLPTFAAREAPDDTVDEKLFAAIAVADKYRCTAQSIGELLQQKAPHKNYGAILFVGAGDVDAYSQQLLQLH